MGELLTDMKKKYNELLETQKKAAEWMDNANEEKQDKHFRRYKNLLFEMENHIKLMDTAGIDYTVIELLEGFKGE